MRAADSHTQILKNIGWDSSKTCNYIHTQTISILVLHMYTQVHQSVRLINMDNNVAFNEGLPS